MKYALSVVICCALWPFGAAAQDAQTLADVRQELTVLSVEIQKLGRELLTTGTSQNQLGGGSLLDRVNGIESELQRLTSKTEELEFRIGRVVADGTNRIGDLEFRLVELEGGDISTLGETSTLGGGAPATTPVISPIPQGSEDQLATQEAADFERANEALASGNFQAAAEQFATFNQTYPGGPLSVQADLQRGEALESLGDTRTAARAYLDAFSADQNGANAPAALYKLGLALGQLGQTQEACVTLGEVSARFPSSEAAQQANDQMRELGCS
jgi:tol-pal system protein YbgF